jgi:hypothetical protein
MICIFYDSITIRTFFFIALMQENKDQPEIKA